MMYGRQDSGISTTDLPAALVTGAGLGGLKRQRIADGLAWLVRGFAIDVRSLAAFRMALAATVLVDLAERVPDLSAHYTDSGVLPRAARLVMEHNGSTTAGTCAWSLHTATGTAAGQAVLFLFSAAFAISMFVGYRTRLATALTWLFTVSLYYRNPLLEDAGDTILRTVLFWSMFLPLGATLSVDRRLRGAPHVPRETVSITGAALLLQICMIYWTTAAEKQSPIWLKDHTALYYALSLDAFATPLGHRLLAFPRLLSWLTVGVYWLEWLGPLVAIAPFGRGLPRLLVVVAFWAFHLGTGLTMELGALVWISMAIWTVFLPGMLWNKLGWKILRGPAARGADGASGQEEIGGARLLYHRSANLLQALVGVLSLYVAVWNVNQVSRCLEDRWPAEWKVPAYVLGLEQSWRMFAPFPLADDGWYEMRGVLADGSVVNLWDEGQPLPRRKPPRVAETYRNRRWRKYLIELRIRWAPFIPDFAEWLRNRWNGRMADRGPDAWVKHIAVVYHVERTLSPDRSSTLIVPEIVFEGDFSNPAADRR